MIISETGKKAKSKVKRLEVGVYKILVHESEINVALKMVFPEPKKLNKKKTIKLLNHDIWLFVFVMRCDGCSAANFT